MIETRPIESTAPPPGIDVAIPCYQYGHFLRDCVESVLAQQVAGLRVVIIDNASTDNSLEVAQQLAAENPAVQVIAHQRNVGPHASFNEAIDWSAQKYFLVLCADDLLAPGALVRAVSILEKQPDAVMAYGPAALLGAGERLTGDGLEDATGSWRLLSGIALLERFCGSAVCHIPSCAGVVRTEVQKRVGYYRRELAHTDDFEMWMRFACHGPVAETSTIQAGLRAHQGAQSAFVREQHRWDLLHCEAAFASFFAQEGSRLPDAARLQRLARRSLGERAYWSAVSHLSRGELAESVALARLALRLRPACALFPPVSYLTRRNDALTRLNQVLSQLVRRRRAAGQLTAR